MPCQLSRMWRLKGRWVVGGEVYANCKQVPFCSSKLYKSVHSVVCIFLCVCLRADNQLFRMYPNTNNFGPLISSKTAWGFPQGLNCTSRSRLTQREGMLLLLLMPSRSKASSPSCLIIPCHCRLERNTLQRGPNQALPCHTEEEGREKE